MFGFRFIKFQPSEYVLKYRNGKIVKEGAGISFYYYAPTTSIVLVPVGSVDVPFIFEEVTSDFQTVTVQGQITFRIVEQKKIAKLLNYTLDIKGKGYVSEDPKKLPQKVINIVRVLAKKLLENLQLKEAIRSSQLLAKGILDKIKENEEMDLLGIEILGVSILAVLPNKETARALEAQEREQILKEADEAIYARRNASIEQERCVKQNEYNTEIAVENKKKQVRETQLDTERIVQQKQNQLKEEKMNFETAMEEKRKELTRLSTQNSRTKADARAYELSVVMKAFEGMNPDVIQSLANVGMQPDKLIAVAFQELAGNAGKIGQLNISPDLLQEIAKGRN
ncbi:SPFH domain-containing protein [Clostridium luticellarii]|jgi:regulator of protease activity HflC (stomatin/prohibitin superfamily)|uniref:SPFH domain / Band 7 family protein n=1 Tax=Clostridium luticellarii TaxID=1691940 RepID=A0A2T0BN74_9CLOT|nr:SPFH domain-containing protein [Clostridium luticellarii]MCI1945677.1 SPFH domain-containing protein [Clostridium luticellarii]MCI1967433.1 SPFH domain-containing protein [Clostridium luticellarii]MCI1996311.1 SPFH domain-containing protein [Clostridium luticellarii]MCI2039784.1 SPFH domain-containing protein [Clostridium luticellarii]PRR85303.1 SPFH domain / Band 7 family protein [Clostridium luticellarii]